jgi:hypothetical protein
MCRSLLSITMSMMLVLLTHDLRGEEPAPFHLGHRASDDLPALTDEELGIPQQQALLNALAGDPYGHRDHDHYQTGDSMRIRKRAIPSNTFRYGAYWVGGGLPVHGDEPSFEEGTFGWDYFGGFFRRRVALNWSHGRRYQGGTGAYKTDGPKLHE